MSVGLWIGPTVVEFVCYFDCSYNFSCLIDLLLRILLPLSLLLYFLETSSSIFNKELQSSITSSFLASYYSSENTDRIIERKQFKSPWPIQSLQFMRGFTRPCRRSILNYFVGCIKLSICFSFGQTALNTLNMIVNNCGYSLYYSIFTCFWRRKIW